MNIDEETGEVAFDDDDVWSPPSFSALPTEASRELTSLVYRHAGEFVTEFVLPNWIHPRGTSRETNWCPMWWEHAEAVSRMEALWMAWESLRQDGGPAMSVFWRDHMDTQMAALTAEHGTFAMCRKEGHVKPPVWDSTPYPDGYFDPPVDSPVRYQ